jgi:hypothetical protein
LDLKLLIYWWAWQNATPSEDSPSEFSDEEDILIISEPSTMPLDLPTDLPTDEWFLNPQGQIARLAGIEKEIIRRSKFKETKNSSVLTMGKHTFSIARLHV